MLERAYQYGTIHLNPIFVKESRPERFKATTVRISGSDIFWSVLVFIPTALILLGLGTLLGSIPAMSSYAGWWFVLVSPFFAFFAGRFLSVKINPYARDSGETLASFLSVMKDNYFDLLAWRLNGQKVVYQTAESCAEGRRKIEKAVVWIGTARAQYTPNSPAGLPGDVFFQFAPSTIQCDWAHQARERKRRLERLSSVEL